MITMSKSTEAMIAFIQALEHYSMSSYFDGSV